MTADKRKTLPNALVIGPQKTGTTWIYQYFKYHDDVCLPFRVKETFFFDRYYHRGINWYAKHFRHHSSEPIIMEVAPSYFHSELAAIRINKCLGIIPLICSLRNPAERCYSLYLHFCRRGMVGLNFREAIINHPVILDSGRYASHLKRWRTIFGKEQILVVFQETLLKNPHRVVSLICNHLLLREMKIPSLLNSRVNQAALPSFPCLARLGKFVGDLLRSYRLYSIVNAAKKVGLKELFFGKPGSQMIPSLMPEDRFWIQDRLKNEIEELENMLNIDLSDWKNK